MKKVDPHNNLSNKNVKRGNLLNFMLCLIKKKRLKKKYNKI